MRRKKRDFTDRQLDIFIDFIKFHGALKEFNLATGGELVFRNCCKKAGVIPDNYLVKALLIAKAPVPTLFRLHIKKVWIQVINAPYIRREAHNKALRDNIATMLKGTTFNNKESKVLAQAVMNTLMGFKDNPTSIALKALIEAQPELNRGPIKSFMTKYPPTL